LLKRIWYFLLKTGVLTLPNVCYKFRFLTRFSPTHRHRPNPNQSIASILATSNDFIFVKPGGHMARVVLPAIGMNGWMGGCWLAAAGEDLGTPLPSLTHLMRPSFPASKQPLVLLHQHPPLALP